MDIVQADAALAEQYAADIPELVHATGPVSYDYHFGRRELFDALVRRSWLTPGSLFGWDGTRLAVENDTLLGIEIGFAGPEYRARQTALGPLWPDLLAAGEATEGELSGVIERSERASWLNPVLRSGIYYVHALSVKPDPRGKQVGMKLLTHAMVLGREQSCRALELDVLSDNPAVHFYRSMGLSLYVESRAPEPQEYGVPPEWRMGIALQE